MSVDTALSVWLPRGFFCILRSGTGAERHPPNVSILLSPRQPTVGLWRFFPGLFLAGPSFPVFWVCFASTHPSSLITVIIAYFPGKSKRQMGLTEKETGLKNKNRLPKRQPAAIYG